MDVPQCPCKRPFRCFATAPPSCLIEAIEILEFRDISLYSPGLRTQLRNRRIEFLLAAPGDENVGSLLYQDLAVPSPIPVDPPVTRAIFCVNF